MKNKGLKFLIIIFAVLLVSGLVKNIIIKSAVSAGVTAITGAPVKIGSFAVGIFRTSIQIKGFQIYNPPGFPQEPMVDINEVRVDYDLPSIIKGKIHCPLIVLDIQEISFVKNQEGKLNVDALKVSEKADQAKKEGAQSTEKKESRPLNIQFDLVRLSLDKVVVKDYSKGEPPAIKANTAVFKDKEFRDIQSVEKLVMLVLVQGMAPAALQSAKLYAAQAILGVGFLPAGIAGVLLGKDKGEAEFAVDFEKGFQTVKDVLSKMGEIKSEDTAAGTIKAKVQGADVNVKIEKLDSNKIRVSVFARQLMIPKPDIANGVLYEVSNVFK